MESMTLGPLELARVLGFELTTVKRLSSQAPGRLPPAVHLGSGRLRSRRVWLRATVEAWLKAREVEGASLQIPPPHDLPQEKEASSVSVPSPGKRPRGRPRKIAIPVTGGAV